MTAPVGGPGRPPRWPLAAAFLAGLAVAAAALAPALYPAEVYGLWCRLRYGAEPSAGGVVLSVAPAPPAAAGEGAGPWVVVELHNVGSAPTVVNLPERPGGELSFEALTASGAPVPGRPPAMEQEAVPIHSVELAPGERLGVVCDLSRWLEVPADARALRVRAERAPVAGDPHRCASSWSVVAVAVSP